MSGTIMIIEDEPKLAELLADYLRQSGFEVRLVADGMAAVPAIHEQKPDLVLLDLMLPGKDGMEICKEVRRFSSVPIIMVTARVEEIDRLLGLEFGADDYICKPYSPREVVARVKAVLRRGGTAAENNHGLVLDEARYSANLHGVELDLTAVEFKLLAILFASPGRIFSRDQLMDRIYSDERIVSERTIDSHIKKLRKKLSLAAADEELIHSVYGVGYKYELPER
ncbi:response regulator [Desulfuromonas acetexigens]|jgi:two-component system response regulator BaeR|uniref:Response regulator n=1 Tax=Trichloromonas acetexigens TaxID=38815 RepID=A0A550JGX0_9BACT|nr:response regulator [Desulfuromonas acetexigens]TRO82466.1 response regulator [Desulfuromonas acetexigens]